MSDLSGRTSDEALPAIFSSALAAGRTEEGEVRPFPLKRSLGLRPQLSPPNPGRKHPPKLERVILGPDPRIHATGGIGTASRGEISCRGARAKRGSQSVRQWEQGWDA